MLQIMVDECVCGETAWEMGIVAIVRDFMGGDEETKEGMCSCSVYSMCDACYGYRGGDNYVGGDYPTGYYPTDDEEQYTYSGEEYKDQSEDEHQTW